MKTILRNFLSVMRRFKMATTLNVLGLSVAFAAFMVILMQLDFDYNFDKMYEHSDRIYRVEMRDEGKTYPMFSRPMANMIVESSPHILSGTIIMPGYARPLITVEKNGNRFLFQEPQTKAYPSFMDVFPFEMTEGAANALNNPSNILLSQSMARRFFENEPAVGKTIEFNGTKWTIGGVFKDFPKNSLVSNAIYTAIPANENIQNWDNNNYWLYIRLDDPANSKGLLSNIVSKFKAIENMDEIYQDENNFQLTVLPDMHFATNVLYDNTPKSSYAILWVLLSIAIAIIVIGAINFTNFSTALTPMRIKSINTQKVMGGDEGMIRRSLQIEAITISVFSYLVALGIVYLLQYTRVVSLVDADIALTAHPMIVGGTAVLALATGLFAGLYPSYYMTSFPPALVLKGSFGLSPKGRQLRNLLVGIQFIASFALIIGASFMYLQNRYMQKTPLGYDKDALVVAGINYNISKDRETFANQLKNYAGIEDVTFGEPLLSSSDQYMGWGRIFKEKQINFQCLPVDPNFLDVMGIPVTGGRGFRTEDRLKRRGALIFNECARAAFDMQVGDMIDSMEIIGFVPDIKFASFRTEVGPMAFYVWGEVNWGSNPFTSYIKVKAGSDMRAAMDHVKATLKAADPEYPFNVRFYDEVLNRLYEKERSLTALITLFSLIAIFISIVGVFGLVVFDSEYRKKEIGIRKVLGSTTQEILILFNKTYVRILCICFILAAPVAYYAIHRWLESFAYKTPMYWWVFLISFVIVSLITILTVTFQNWWTANENPVESIKTE